MGLIGSGGTLRLSGSETRRSSNRYDRRDHQLPLFIQLPYSSYPNAIPILINFSFAIAAFGLLLIFMNLIAIKLNLR